VAAAVARCNPAKHRGPAGARVLHHTSATVVNETPDARDPLDEARLGLVRDFLLREFRGWYQTDYFDGTEAAQVFVLETEHGRRHTLVVPVETFADTGFMRLCDAELATALKLAPGGRLTLMLSGVRFN
jgi:hypothetical protein